MLVLVSFGLVLLATILLVVGLLTDDGLELIYLSIACSATAAVVLAFAFRRAKPKAEKATEPPEPILPESEEPAAPTTAAAPSPATPSAEPTTITPVVADPEAEAAQDVNPGGTPTADTETATEPTEDDWVDDDDWADGGDYEVEFPIADYDELTVDEIMPLLPQLYSDELEIVAERERSTKNRSTILAKLEQLAETGTDADVDDVDPQDVASGADEAFAPAEPARRSAPAPQVPSLADDDWDGEVVFPIADYDELTADQIIPLLSQLEDDELEDVKAREVEGQGRKSVITEIDRQLGRLDDGDDAAWRADDEVPARPRRAAEAPAGRPAPEAEAPEGSVLAISGYDGLTVAQIRPLLSGLSADELRAVLDHEVARDNRRTIVSEIERRLESADEPAPAPAPTKSAARSATKARSTKKAAARPAARTAKKAARKSAKKAAAPRFPIARYDELTVAEIRPRLSDLSDRELRQVREREERGAGRKTILTEIDRRLG